MPRIVTYNVHRCVGTDRRLDVGRVAEVLAALNPDIVALQELDVTAAGPAMLTRRTRSPRG